MQPDAGGLFGIDIKIAQHLPSEYQLSWHLGFLVRCLVTVSSLASMQQVISLGFMITIFEVMFTWKDNNMMPTALIL